MTCALLDSDVLIDVLRGTGPAREWIDENREQPFLVPGVVAMELVVGSRDKHGLQRALKLLRHFEVAWPSSHETRRAYDLLIEHSLSTAIGIPDCMIAAMAIERSLHLHSFNLKHFRQIEGLEVSAPYAR